MSVLSFMRLCEARGVHVAVKGNSVLLVEREGNDGITPTIRRAAAFWRETIVATAKAGKLDFGNV